MTATFEHAAELAALMWARFDDRSTLMEMLNDSFTKDEILLCVRLFYSEGYMTNYQLKERFCEETGIYPEIWEEAIGDRSFAYVLALESSDCKSSGRSLAQMLTTIERICENERPLLKICHSMSEVEARLFWHAVLGERFPIAFKTFVSGLALLHRPKIHRDWGNVKKSKGKKRAEIGFSRTVVELADTMGKHELVSRILKDQNSLPRSEILNPRRAIKGGTFLPWGHIHLPADTYLDVVGGSRYFLHSFGTSMGHDAYYLRDRTGARLNAEQVPFTPPPDDWIVEVEVTGDPLEISVVTDCLYHRRPMADRPYSERITYLNESEWANLTQVRTLRPVPEHESSTTLLEQVPPDTSLRLLKDEPYQFGMPIGWVLAGRAFEFNVLLTDIRRDRNNSLHARIAVMDGHDPFPVAQIILPKDVGPAVSDRLAKRGVSFGTDWEDVCEKGIVLRSYCSEIDPNSFQFNEPAMLSVIDDSGLGDVNQLTDVIEVMI